MGVGIIGKDVSVISSITGKAKANISSIFGATGWSGGEGFVANDLLFNDLSIGSPTGNTQTSPKTGTLYLNFDVTYSDGVSQIYFNKNGTDVAYFLIDAPVPVLQWTISVNSGDSLYFYLTRSGPPMFWDEGIMTIRNLNSSGTIIDTFYLVP